ncbi:glycosyltransferase family 4 protein [Selenomonas ruminantium]|uniref:glycosyltransferase family 4 protein n=1 Tax=Selenomonas ruminantium TaxID=971 RepID=UPI0026EC5A86|nr:glycosyltransferase family 4 protein [Selenomonas ruminantium]
MKVLLCLLDAIVEYDGDNNIYVDELGWFERFKGFKNDFVIIARGEKITHPTRNMKMNEEIRIVDAFFVENNIPSSIEEFRKLVNIINKAVDDCDKVFIRYQGAFVHFACKRARKYQKPYLIEIGGVQWDAFWNHSLKGKMIAAPLEYWCKKDIYQADYVHYVTENYLQKRYPTKGKYIGLSNVVLHERNDVIIADRYKRIDQHGKQIIIGTAAAINVKYKGQKYVIEALRLLKQRGYKNFVYQLAGMGDSERLKKCAVEAKVENQVQFLGKLSHDDIFKWLDSIDVYIQPSLQEGLPRAMIEAMSRALPCIGAKTAGIPELIDNKYIYEHNNMPEKIADLLLRITVRDEMIEQATNNFNNSKRYMYNEILDKRNRFYAEFFKS